MNSLFLSPRRWLALIALLACAGATGAFAQTDPPGRIGRIATLTGTANLYNPTTGESFRAPLNQPLTSGDILNTGPESRIEIQIGSMSVRLDGASNLQLIRIDDEHVRLALHGGRAIAKLDSRETLNDFSLETRDGRFTALDTGIYRIDIDESTTTGTAYYGTLRFDGRGEAIDITAGQSARFSSGQPVRYSVSNAIQDEFTRWSAHRDQQLASRNTLRYVSPEMTGSTDLDAYGRWSESPEYGAIWFPQNVTADWAPYREGHWSWIAPWGWSWIGNEPWGFAPFHYGRWVRHHGHWGWVPGTRLSRPHYAPALVAWTRVPGASISITSGHAPMVGWFPLAPREVYVPLYRSSEHHVRRINATHINTIPNLAHIVNNPHDAIQRAHYAHREAPHAVTQTTAKTFIQPPPASRYASPATTPHREQTQERRLHEGTERETRQQENRPPSQHFMPMTPRPAVEVPRHEPIRTETVPSRGRERVEESTIIHRPILPAPRTAPLPDTPHRPEYRERPSSPSPPSPTGTLRQGNPVVTLPSHNDAPPPIIRQARPPQAEIRNDALPSRPREAHTEMRRDTPHQTSPRETSRPPEPRHPARDERENGRRTRNEEGRR